MTDSSVADRLSNRSVSSNDSYSIFAEDGPTTVDDCGPKSCLIVLYSDFESLQSQALKISAENFAPPPLWIIVV